MAANAEIYFEHDRWGRALAWSAGLHVGITVLLLVYSACVYRTSGDAWGAGGGGEAIGATLVSTVPLPANPAQTQNVLANESKGLTQSQPKIEEKEPDAIEIQGKNAKIKPKKKQETASKEKPQAAPEEERQPGCVWRRRAGQRAVWNVQRSAARRADLESPEAAAISAPYSWYVHVIQRKVSENWLKYEVDPRITTAQRVYITFRYRARWASGECAGGAVERRAVAGYFGGTRPAAHRYFRSVAAGLLW